MKSERCRGFGQIVTEQMVAQQVGGKVDVDYRSEGVRWTLQIPPSELARSTAEAGSTPWVQPTPVPSRPPSLRQVHGYS